MGKGICVFCKSQWNILKPLALLDTPSSNHMIILEYGSINDYKTIRRLLGHVLKKKKSLNQAVLIIGCLLMNIIPNKEPSGSLMFFLFVKKAFKSFYITQS